MDTQQIRNALGASSVTIDHQLVGFYYTFGTFTMQEWVDDNDTLYQACSEVQHTLAQRFEKNLRALPQWTTRVDDMTFDLFEMCADDMEDVEIDGRPAFSLWVYHGGSEVPKDTIKAFRDALLHAIDSLSHDSDNQIQVRYLSAETQTTVKARISETVSLDD